MGNYQQQQYSKPGYAPDYFYTLHRGVSRTGLRGPKSEGGGSKSCKCKVTGAIKA